MVQLRVKTALQEDYVRNLPFHVAAPVPSNSGGKANAPLIATVGTTDGQLNIFHVLESDDPSTRKLYNTFFDVSTDTWVSEDTGWSASDLVSPIPGVLKVARHPVDGTLHVALAHVTANPDGSFVTTVHYLALRGRYPKWQSIILDQPDEVQSRHFIPAVSIDVAFRNGSVAFVTIFRMVPFVPTTSVNNSLFTWTPSESHLKTWASYPQGDQKEAMSHPIYGQFPYPNLTNPLRSDGTLGADPPIQWGWYCTGASSDETFRIPNWMLRLPESGDISAIQYAVGPSALPTVPIYQLYNATFDCLFVPDPTKAPLLFALNRYNIDGANLTTPAIHFVPNTLYFSFFSNSVRRPNTGIYQLFDDVRGTPVWLEVTLRESGATADNEITWGVNAFAVFEVSSNNGHTSVELWHTQTLPGAVTLMTDNIYG